MEKKLNILLIKPSFYLRTGNLYKGKNLTLINLTLPYLASLLSPHNVKIVFERVEDINFNMETDLIMISSLPSDAARANEISDEFRKRGKTVIIGGFYPTMYPKKALEHADSIVIGEAENIIKKLISDFVKKRLKKMYKSKDFHNLKNLPIGRFDLIKKKYISPLSVWPIQSTRGCPRKCDFCTIWRFQGKINRKRPINDVVNEMKKRGKLVYFIIDDNPTIDYSYLKELLKSIKGLAKAIMINMDPLIVDNDEILDYAKEAGVSNVFVGIETLNPASIQDAKNFGTVESYKRLIKKLLDRGIFVNASIIVGFDHDTKETFNKTLKLIEDLNLPLLYLWILTPPQGSVFYEKLKKENRLLYDEYFFFEPETAMGTRAIFKPKNMSVKELEEGYWKLFQKFYAWRSIIKRIVLHPNKNINRTLRLLFRNILAHYSVKKKMHPLFAV